MSESVASRAKKMQKKATHKGRFFKEVKII